MSHRTQQPDEPGTDAQLGAGDDDVSAQLETLRERIDGLEAALRDVREENNRLRSELEDVSDRTDRLDDGIRNAHDRIGDVEEQLHMGATDTELDVALHMPADVREDRYAVAELRAITIAQHLGSVGGNDGARINKNLMRRVERERDESLAWSQLYRACEALESLTDGGVVFVEEDGDTNRLHINNELVLP